jgi:hypothetical protein
MLRHEHAILGWLACLAGKGPGFCRRILNGQFERWGSKGAWGSKSSLLCRRSAAGSIRMSLFVKELHIDRFGKTLVEGSKFIGFDRGDVQLHWEFVDEAPEAVIIIGSILVTL